MSDRYKLINITIDYIVKLVLLFHSGSWLGSCLRDYYK